MRQALFVLLAQISIVAWAFPLQAVDEPYQVLGEWHFCSDFKCSNLEIGEKVVNGGGRTVCTGVTVKWLAPSLATVECHSDVSGLLQYYFMFDTKNRAFFWSISSNQVYTSRENDGLAQRRMDGPIPAEILGRWYVSNWTPMPKDHSIQFIDIQPNQVTITDSRQSHESRAIQLSSSPEGEREYDIELISETGLGVMLRMRNISQEVLITRIEGRTFLLHREERPPSWFAAELQKSCDGLADPALRENCYSSRSICEMVAENERSPLCIELVKQKKGDLATAEVKNNLGAIAAVETAYFAEWGKWVGGQDFTPVANRSGNNALAKWVRSTRFSILGFAPEGDVQCSYSLEGNEFPTKEEGFSAKAQCDFDANGKLSIWSITNRNRRIEHSGDDF